MPRTPAAIGLALISVATLTSNAPVLSNGIDVSFEQDSQVSVTLCRGIIASQWIVLNWHCLDDLKRSFASGHQVWVTNGVIRAPLSRGALSQTAPAALKIAESAGLDFSLLPLPLKLPIGVETLSVAPPDVAVGDRVGLRQNGSFAATCQVSKVCGSRVHYSACSATPARGWSGSSVWLLKNGTVQPIGLHKDGPGDQPEGSARLLSAIMGRSSVLATSDEEFSSQFARSRRYRFRNDPPGACTADTGKLTVLPFVTLGKRTIQGLARLDDGTILTTDLHDGQICRFRWPSTAAEQCWDNPDPHNDRVNAILPLHSGMFALAKANDGSARNPGALRIFRLQGGSPLFEDSDIQTNIGTVYGLAESGGDLIALGSLGLCTVAISQGGRECIQPEKSGEWRVNGALSLGPNSFVAVGRDKANGLSFPVCKWFTRNDGHWRRSAQCVRAEALLATSRQFKANSRSFQFKAPVQVNNRLFVFGSDGGAYEIRPNYRPRPIRITGIAYSDERLEDAARDAKVVGPRHIALAASDGAFRILKLGGTPDAPVFEAFDMGTRYTAFDLAIWTTQIVVGKDSALVRGQDGSVNSVTWERLP